MPARKHILPGTRFARFVVIGPSNPRYGPNGYGRSASLCKCDCGKTKPIENSSLRSGASKSCGCVAAETKSRLRHGRSHTPIHQCWSGMMQRCYNPNTRAFKDYGGRGIKVCERWMIFENFLADMGEKPEGLTIERINNALGYNKENCKWATKTEQSRNRRFNRLISFNGATLPLSVWAEKRGMRRQTIARRLKAGWTPERAITEPAQPWTGGQKSLATTK